MLDEVDVGAGGPWQDLATTTTICGAAWVDGWGLVKKCKKLPKMMDASAGEMYM